MNANANNTVAGATRNFTSPQQTIDSSVNIIIETNQEWVLGRNGTLTVGALISENGGSYSVGTSSSGSFGRLELTNDANSFSGDLTNSNGNSTVSVTSIGNMGVNSAAGAGDRVNLTGSNGDFEYAGSADAVTDRTFRLAQTNIDINNEGSGSLTLNGLIDLDSNNNRNFGMGGNGGEIIVNVDLDETNNGAFTFTKNGNNTVTLNGTDSDYRGTTNVNGGELHITNLQDGGVNSSIGSGTDIRLSGNGRLVYAGTTDASTDRTLAQPNNAGNDQAVVIDNSGDVELNGTLTYESTNDRVRGFDFEANSTGVGTMNGVIDDNSASYTTGGINDDNNGLAVDKTGTGTWRFTAANTYRNSTDVEEGTLLINNTTGSGTGYSEVTVSSGASLGGTGIITPGDYNNGGSVVGRDVTYQGGSSLSPGDGGIGTFTFALDNSDNVTDDDGNRVIFASGAMFAFDVGAGLTNDRVDITDTTATSLTLTDVEFNDNIFAFTDLTGGSLSAGTYTLFSFDANTSIGGLVDTGNFTGLESYGSDVSLSQDSMGVYLTVVPEPSTALLFLSAAGALALGRRRRG